MMSHLVRAAHRRVQRFLHPGRPVVLMYHRVADVAHDPWNLAVPPGLFAEQIAALCSAFTVVPLEDVLTARSDRPLAAVTFDDGYADVVENALPVLDRHDCPATLFVVTDALRDRTGDARGFWWDTLCRLLLEHVPERTVPFDDGEVGLRLEISPGDDDQVRRKRHFEAWKILKSTDPERRRRAISELSRALGLERGTDGADVVLTRRQLSALKGTVLTVGAHTLTHPSLPDLSPETRRHEIFESREACRELTGSEPPSFSYPFGDYDDDCARLVREAGFSLAVTVDDGLVGPDTSAWKVPRIAVHGHDGDKIARLST